MTAQPNSSSSLTLTLSIVVSPIVTPNLDGLLKESSPKGWVKAAWRSARKAIAELGKYLIMLFP